MRRDFVVNQGAKRSNTGRIQPMSDAEWRQKIKQKVEVIFDQVLNKGEKNEPD
jgi:hypothetical protein